MAPWPSGKAKVCNTSTPGSNPGGASSPDRKIRTFSLPEIPSVFCFFFGKDKNTLFLLGGNFMFKHEKQLLHPVGIERPNPQYAALLQEQLAVAMGS